MMYKVTYDLVAIQAVDLYAASDFPDTSILSKTTINILL